MYAVELELYINSDPHIIQHFNGIFNINERLPTYIKFPSSYIFNIGEHWVSIFIDKFQHGEYFDSCGLPPPYTVFKFLEANCVKWKYNNQQIQGRSSTLCGYYALLFLRHRSIGQEFEDFIFKFKDCNNDYSKDSRVRDLFLRAYGLSKVNSVECAIKRMKLLHNRMESRILWK